MALELVFTTFVSVLAAFDIAKACDENGKEITPTQEYSSGSIKYVSIRCLARYRGAKRLLFI